MVEENDAGAAPRARNGATGTPGRGTNHVPGRSPDPASAPSPGPASVQSPAPAPPRGSAPAPGPKRRAGRPRTAVLSQAHITAAALEIIGERGYEALTMSALASRLGVAPSALYNHVANKHELLAWVENSVMAEVDHSGFGMLPLREALRRWAVSYRDVFAHHGPLIPVIAVLPVGGAPATVTMYEAVAAGMAAGGWERARIIPAIVALESFIFGSALDATAPRDIFDAAGGRRGGEFAAALRAQRAEGVDPADDAFFAGLDALLDGLCPQVPQET
ncbi:TetR family transcriptional regulator [Zafaria sp. Z1313]|uniref:TetR/AcrR family transcriptional regulator n=1 Tax=unclassified Zafaria TaxID=2828765 RepID=UPI002E77F21A|nr:TetR family transcriptional regulator [Zafaria sp. J156]MEE1619780.1 TetR family transcriptional regulator [Zafaria sp. J156]